LDKKLKTFIYNNNIRLYIIVKRRNWKIEVII
jgi:hypothetical protein